MNQSSQKPKPLWLDLAMLAGVLLFCAYSLHVVTLSASHSEPGSAPLTNPEADRRPAATTSHENRAHIGTLRLPCPRNRLPASSLSATTRLVQLQAGACSELSRGNWTARNERTGEEIQLFVGSDGSLSTSYFALQEGHNRLVFSSTNEKGRARTETVELNRLPAEGE